MGGTSEREFMERINQTREKVSKVVTQVSGDFTKIEKLKAEALKKGEEMRRSAVEKLEKLEQHAAKEKDLVPESKRRISVEIIQARKEIRRKYDETKARIAKAMVPV